MKPKIAVLLAPGTNCHEETAFAVEQSGAEAEILIVNRLLGQPKLIFDYSAVVIPGGFSWGDHFGSGRAFALICGEILRQYEETFRPMLGICNGFQAMMEAGLFNDGSHSGGALVQNISGKFESRPVNLLALPSILWTDGYEGAILRMPVAHGEGRWLMPRNGAKHLSPTFAYCDEDGKIAGSEEDYPVNPNGTIGGITGLSYDNVMGMMPHPERAIDPDLGSSDGRFIFDALVRLARG